MELTDNVFLKKELTWCYLLSGPDYSSCLLFLWMFPHIIFLETPHRCFNRILELIASAKEKDLNHCFIFTR